MLKTVFKSSITKLLVLNEKQRTVSKALKHESNHGGIDKSNGGGSLAFVIFAQTLEVT